MKHIGRIHTIELRYMAALMMSLACLLLLGCQQHKPGSSHSSSCKLWPIFDVTKSEGVNDDGSKWLNEKGDAILVAHWNNRKTYDSNGLLVGFDDYSEVWPLFEARSSKKDGAKDASGTILLFLKFGSSGQETENGE